MKTLLANITSPQTSTLPHVISPFLFLSAYGLAALDRTGGRNGIASSQALASAFQR
jgi:hypothetical protein